MINCAHPTHFDDALEKGEAWVNGCAACAPMRRRAAMPNSTIRPISMPAIRSISAAAMRSLRGALGTRFNILGGCCGTDHRHVAAIAEACLPLRAAAIRRWRHPVCASRALQ